MHHRESKPAIDCVHQPRHKTALASIHVVCVNLATHLIYIGELNQTAWPYGQTGQPFRLIQVFDGYTNMYFVSFIHDVTQL